MLWPVHRGVENVGVNIARGWCWSPSSWTAKLFDVFHQRSSCCCARQIYWTNGGATSWSRHATTLESRQRKIVTWNHIQSSEVTVHFRFFREEAHLRKHPNKRAITESLLLSLAHSLHQKQTFAPITASAHNVHFPNNTSHHINIIKSNTSSITSPKWSYPSFFQVFRYFTLLWEVRTCVLPRKREDWTKVNTKNPIIYILIAIWP